MTADLKALRYLTAPNQIQSDKTNKSPGIQNGGPMFHYDPYDHRCCQHNVAMGWPYFSEHVWMATSDNGLVAMFYSESKVKAKVGNGREVTITENTHYPFRDKVGFKLSMSAATRFPLYLRVPNWCENASITINGKKAKITSRPGKLIRIDREWKNGDAVSLTMPMKVSTTQYAANKNSISVQRGPLTYSLKIAEKATQDGGTKTWPAYSVYPDSPWNYGLDTDRNNHVDVQVVERPWPADNQPFNWNSAPLELKIKGRQIDAWKADERGLVSQLQQSPAKVSTPLETITLIPMGCARLRISAFPTVTLAESGTSWIKPKDMIPAEASYINSIDSVSALSDGIVPKDSSDQSIPRFTWWDHKGTSEWVQYIFDKPKQFQSVSVYWFNDAPDGFCRTPEDWSISYWIDGKWKAVENASGYGVSLDVFNTVSFTTITTTKLRLNLKLRSGFSSGILEWVVK
jgi:hypothetical protein